MPEAISWFPNTFATKLYHQSWRLYLANADQWVTPVSPIQLQTLTTSNKTRSCTTNVYRFRKGMHVYDKTCIFHHVTCHTCSSLHHQTEIFVYLCTILFILLTYSHESPMVSCMRLRQMPRIQLALLNVQSVWTCRSYRSWQLLGSFGSAEICSSMQWTLPIFEFEHDICIHENDMTATPRKHKQSTSMKQVACI